MTLLFKGERVPSPGRQDVQNAPHTQTDCPNYGLYAIISFSGWFALFCFYGILFNVLFESNPEKQNTSFWKC